MNSRTFEHMNDELRSYRNPLLTSLFVVLLFNCSTLFSQTPKIEVSTEASAKVDSLQNLLKADIADTTRMNTLNALGWELKLSKPDTSIILSKQALELAMKNEDSPNEAIAKAGKKGQANAFRNLGALNYLKGNYPNALKNYHKAMEIWEEFMKQKPPPAFALRAMAGTVGNIGAVYYNQGDYPRALDYYFKALKTSEELGDKNGIAINLGNIGLVYLAQGDYPRTLDYLFKALKMAKELENKSHIAEILGNIGLVYLAQGDYPRALDYLFKALKMAEELGNKNGIATDLCNIGLVYWNQGDYPKALEYYFKALKMREELGDKNGIAINLGNIGNVYIDQGKFSKALEYNFKALKMAEELGDKNGIARHLGNIGSHYAETGRFKEAELYFDSALALCDNIGALNYTKIFEESMSQLYDTTGRIAYAAGNFAASASKYQLALEHYKKYSIAKDSLFNEEKSKDLGKLEAKHEFEKAETERQHLEEKEQSEILQAQQRRNNLQYSGILIFLVSVFAGVFALGKFKIPLRLAEGLIFFAFLLFFEFTLVLLDPYIEQFSGGEPAYKLLFNAVLAGMIFPLHAFFESRLKRQLLR